MTSSLAIVTNWCSTNSEITSNWENSPYWDSDSKPGQNYLIQSDLHTNIQYYMGLQRAQQYLSFRKAQINIQIPVN